VFLGVSTAPTGAKVIVDVKKNGSTIFTSSPKPEIAISAFSGSVSSIDDDDWNDGDYLTIQITQVGSTIPGEYLRVHVVYD
jgi:hypothetical protein